MRHGFAVSAFLLGLAGCGEPTPPTDRAAPPAAAPTPAPSTPVSLPVRKAGSMPNVGDLAPDFRVRDHKGTERTLAEFKGRRVVLWFFPKADTPGWTVEGCGFRDRSPEFAKKNVVLLGISYDTVEANRAFAEKYQFPYPLLCDTDRTVGIAYGLATEATAPYAKRATFVIGPDGRLEHVIGSVDPRSHPETLLGLLP